MLSPSKFVIPRKVRLSVQILMTLDNWSLNSLPEYSLLFLKFIRLFVTSQMGNAPLITAPGRFELSGLYYDPEHSFILAKYWISQSSSVDFICFHFGFEFFKSIRVSPNFICNICKIFIDFSPISSSLSSSWITLFRPESESSSSDSLLVPKILFRLPASSLSSSASRLTLSSYLCSESPPPDLFWHSFLLSVSDLEELILIFCIFFSALLAPQVHFLNLMMVQSLLSHHQIIYLS